MDLEKQSFILKQNIWDILEKWLIEIKETSQIEADKNLTSIELVEQVPLVLLAISEAMASLKPKEVREKDLFGKRAYKRGRVRLRQGFSLEEVIREYIILRNVVWNYLAEKKIVTEESLQLEKIVNETIDNHLLETVRAFVGDYTKDLKNRALKDSLTAVLNRSSFFEKLDQEIKRSKRYGHPLCLMMIDLDHFKKYNDFLGHLAGDAYLRMFADFLTKSSRKSDLVARYGGDEFVIILPEADLEQATMAAERMRKDFLKNRNLRTGVAKTSLSIGIAENFNNDSKLLYSLADKALYLAKKNGGNCVVNSKDLALLDKETAIFKLNRREA